MKYRVYKCFFKRVVDLFISLLLLPFLFLVYLVVAVFIKLEDGGPIFYKGERVGKNCSFFYIYKFRSMKVNSIDIRNADGSTYNESNDPRLTNVGKFLRKTSIDEFPQILNVLKGDMSLIGPRPSPCGNMKLYSDEYKMKFLIRPGITGYTQAFYRNSIPILEKQKYDLFYIENVSFHLDVKIIFRTIKTIINREGLYTNEP